MDETKPKPKSFSGYFFANLFLSLSFSLLIFFLFIRLKSTEKSFADYFSKVLNNFQVNFEQSVYNEYILTWFNPSLKSDTQEKFNKYKLSILAKTINTFFKNILVETQNNIVTGNLKDFVVHKKLSDLEKLKVNIKKHLINNPDLREVSTYDLEGNKIFGIKFKGSPNYQFNQEVIDEVIKNKNLLLKHGENQNLILLSAIENEAQKPFLIVSQSIQSSFFNRILAHLEIDNDVFYIKDSKNFVLFDNHSTKNVDQAQYSKISYKIYSSLTDPSEKNLKVNLNNISYSLGTIVQKNNIWGNIATLGFLLTVFLFSFFCIDLLFGQAKKYFNQERTSSEDYALGNNLETAFQKIYDSPNQEASTELAELDHSNYSLNDSKFSENYEQIKPLTLEQYLLKGKKESSKNILDL